MAWNTTVALFYAVNHQEVVQFLNIRAPAVCCALVAFEFSITSDSSFLWECIGQKE